MDSNTINGLPPEQMDAVRLMKSIKSLAEAVVDMVKAIAETVKATINVLSAMWEKFLCTGESNQRIAHLSLHGKKLRIRKKNLNRLNAAFVKQLKN